MNSRFYRRLIFSTLLITAVGMWVQCNRVSESPNITTLKEQAASGNADAQYFLAGLYFDGQGVPLDYDEAALWYRKAAEQGDADAQYSLAGMYFDGQGVRQDFTQAAFWYRKAAEQGDIAAQCLLGRQYMAGVGVPQDYAEAYFWFDLAGAYYLSKPEPITKRRDEAAPHLTPADLARVQERVRKWFEDHPTKPQ